MITCQHAKHLFDQYLDGELSPSLQTELHAHQLNCSECQGELALLEACGDVIAYDHCEPIISDSFTNRVLLAHRAQVKPVARRNWSRLVITIASPVAAAACIAFAVLLIGPTGKPVRSGIVLSRVDEVSSPLAGILNPGRQHQESSAVHEMPTGFADAILGSFVEQTKNTFDTTKRSVEQLDSLIRLGFAGANDALAAGSRTFDSDRTPAAEPVRPSMSEPDLIDPFSPHPASGTPDQNTGPEVDDTIVAM